MAEEIRLVGSFNDQITPKLKKLDAELKRITKRFEKFDKVLRKTNKEMGTMVSVTERLNSAFKAQRKLVDDNTRAYVRFTRVARNAAKIQPPKRAPVAPVPRGGTTRGGGGGRYGGGMMGGAAYGFAGGFGASLGFQLQNAIFRGFQMGVQLMMTPFKFLANGIGERIADEMSDVRAAGGLFAIARRAENPFVRNFAEARTLTEQTNRYLAQLAGALPGDTQEYIMVAKQISDSIATIISNDQQNAMNLGRELAAARGADTGVFARGGQEAQQAAFKEMTGELTKLTVLAGLGGQQGAFGLPQLTEQMISRDQVSVGQFRRYSAVFRDPMIMGALERNVQNINATTKSTTERFEAIRQMFEEVVTPELVRSYQRTTAGVLEALKTSFLNPEVGLMGLGRPIKMAARQFDQFGKDIGELEDGISVFHLFRDIFANLMIVMQPVIDILPQLYEPFLALATELENIRRITMALQYSFEQYTNGLKQFAEGIENADLKAAFESTIPFRAALSTLNNLFLQLGIFGQTDFDTLAADIMDPTKGITDFVDTLRGMFQTFLDSDAAFQMGEKIGAVLGTVLATFAEVITGILGLGSGTQLASGFSQGFEEAGGIQAIKDILGALGGVILSSLKFVITNFPMESAMVAFVALLPAIVTGLMAGLGQLFVMAVPKLLGALFAKGSLGGIGAAIGGTKIGAMLLAALTNPITAAIAAVAGLGIVAKLTEGLRQKFTEMLRTLFSGDDIVSQFLNAIMTFFADLIEGVGNFFAGVYELAVGIFTDPEMVASGIQKIASSIGNFVMAIVNMIKAIVLGIPAAFVAVGAALRFLGKGVANAIRNLVEGIGIAISNAWANRPAWMGGAGGEGATPPPAETNYMGSGLGSIMAAIDKESARMPYGATPMVANTSELVATPKQFTGLYKAAYNEGLMASPQRGMYASSATSPGSKEVNFGNINVTVTGVNDPKEIADIVAEEIMTAVQRSTYSELYV